MRWKDGTKAITLNNACEILYLGVSNEGNANREFSLHATREGLGASMPLVLQVQDTKDSVHLIGNLFFGEAFQLEYEAENVSHSFKYKLELVQGCVSNVS